MLHNYVKVKLAMLNLQSHIVHVSCYGRPIVIYQRTNMQTALSFSLNIQYIFSFLQIALKF